MITVLLTALSMTGKKQDSDIRRNFYSNSEKECQKRAPKTGNASGKMLQPQGRGAHRCYLSSLDVNCRRRVHPAVSDRVRDQTCHPDPHKFSADKIWETTL